jgi:hypothetical protein
MGPARPSGGSLAAHGHDVLLSACERALELDDHPRNGLNAQDSRLHDRARHTFGDLPQLSGTANGCEPVHTIDGQAIRLRYTISGRICTEGQRRVRQTQAPRRWNIRCRAPYFPFLAGADFWGVVLAAFFAVDFFPAAFFGAFLRLAAFAPASRVSRRLTTALATAAMSALRSSGARVTEAGAGLLR